ncbi:MAG: MBL fold metallo-hydrolase [Nitrospirota bacterium]|nr:MBL fold metallo-hydrolase [Nitrospirota bacterium]
MQLGKIELFIVSDGTMRLDGGAMFGIVPKTLWEKVYPADDKNRILIALNCLLIKTGGKNILVDTGIGDRWDAKFLEIYDIDRSVTLTASLRKLGLKPEDIDIVINTHLHFDHCGGNTRKDEKGRWVATFPNARYIVQKGEWRDAYVNSELRKGSYLPDCFEPVAEAGLFDLVEGDVEVTQGVRVVRTPGHTRYHQSVLVESEGEKAFYLGDTVPSPCHLPLNYMMGYDLYPETLLRTRKKILRQAFRERWLMVFEHDPRMAMGYLRMGKKGYELEAQ